MAIYKPGYIQRIFNAFTDQVNNEEGFIKWVANVFTIGTAKTGSGTARDLEFDVSGTKLHVKADGTIYLDAAGQTVGNARGVGAVDLQVYRNNAAQVAAGAYSITFGAYSKAVNAACISMGYGAVATYNYSIAMGNAAAANQEGAIAIGYGATVGGTGAVALGGATANGAYSTAFGVWSLSANTSQISAGYGAGVAGGAQLNLQPLYVQTTDATQTVLCIAASTTSRIVIPAKRACTVYGIITAFSDTYKAASWEIKCLIVRDASNVTRIVGTPDINQLYADAEADSGGWDVLSVTADDINEALAITVQGQAATNIRWQGTLIYGQVGY